MARTTRGSPVDHDSDARDLRALRLIDKGITISGAAKLVGRRINTIRDVWLEVRKIDREGRAERERPVSIDGQDRQD